MFGEPLPAFSLPFASETVLARRSESAGLTDGRLAARSRPRDRIRSPCSD
jgi:hypothetical protein